VNTAAPHTSCDNLVVEDRMKSTSTFSMTIVFVLSQLHFEVFAQSGSDAIRQQIAKYTAALDAADIDLAGQVWRTSPDVSFIHPAGHAHGWEEITGFYKFFGSAFSERKLTVRDVTVHVNGDSAWAEFYWHFVAKQRNDGSVVETDGRETQIYNRAGNRWQLVHVHYSGPAMTP
jgi:ketosteroid isomerase-like protein